MKSTIYLFLLIIALFISVASMAQDFAWAKNMGGSGSNNISYSIDIDNKGNSYITGWFSGTVDFDPDTSVYNLTSTGGTDIFISKLNSKGEFVWAKKIGGINDDRGESIHYDDNGNVLITGLFTSTVDFDPDTASHQLSSNGYDDIFILKLDTNGQFVLAKTFGSSQLDWGLDIYSDSLGNIYTTGFFMGNVDFDPSNSSYVLSGSGATDAFILKLDSLGNFSWARKIGASGNDRGFGIDIDFEGNVYVSGHFEKTVDFDPSIGTKNLVAKGGTDIYVAKYTTTGNLAWAVKMGGSTSDFCRAIVLDNLGNLYTTGQFSGLADFDPGMAAHILTTSGVQDVFVSKLDTSGNFVWAKKIGGTSVDFGKDITIDKFGSIYTVGYYSNTVDFDPGTNNHTITSNGLLEFFISKLDSNGNFSWALSFGGTRGDEGNGIEIDDQGSIYTTGHFKNTADFDPSNSTFNLTSHTINTSDIFVLKLTQCNNSSSTMAVSTCETYTSPSGKYKWTNSGTFKDTILNATGCDSIITIGLQIKKSSSSVLFKSVCDSLVSPSGKYTWYQSGTYTDTLHNSNGCDSTMIIGLTIAQSSTTAISDTACVSYLSPSGKYIWTQSGNYSDTLPNVAGCDSILNIALTIIQNISIILNEKSCGSYLSPSGKYLWTSSGTYYDTTTAINGCDTTFTIILSVDSVDTSVSITGSMSLKANALGAIYQWVDCNNAFAVIPGKNHQSFTATKSGSYAVIVSQFTCTDTSSCYQLINTGIFENQDRMEFRFYPNPVQNTLIIESQTAGIIRIYEGSGQLVYESISEKSKYAHNISALSNGIYLLQFTSNNLSISKKFIISK